MGNARNLRYSRAPLPRRPAPQRRDFIFNLSMRESKASPVVVCSPCRRKKALSTRCQLICWPLLPTFLGGLVTQPNKGRTISVANASGTSRRCKYFLVGFSWTTLMLLCTRVPKLHVRAVESLFWMCMALVTSIIMAGGACKCGVGSLVHRRKFDRSQSDVAVSVRCSAGVSFTWTRPTQQPNECWVSHIGFGMVERSSLSVLLS